MQNKPEQVPLWRQLQATAQVIQAVREGQSGSAAVEAVQADLRPGVQALAFHAWRNLGRAEALRKQLAKRPPPPAVDALLCVALALAWTDEDAPYDAFTLVNQCVEAAKRMPDTRAQASFVNACLRRFLREREALVASTDTDPVARWNHPAWWIARLKKDHPQAWQALLQSANRQAPMTLRVNALQTTVTEYLQELAGCGIDAHAVGDSGIELERALPVGQLPGFATGRVSVQDAAAQLAAPLLLDGLSQPNLRVLDACAAPGGKTGHLLERGVAHVSALDVDARRCERISQNLARLGLQAQVLAADAARPDLWWDGQIFDAILLDAPCTASGIVRRHPDVRWLRRETDIAQLAELQRKLLQALWPLLAPGGRLLYCTCSVFLAEGTQQVQTFLAHNTDAVLLPSPGHLIPGKPAKSGGVPDNRAGDHDGFFYALLQKQAV
ncbi:16S rRNA (cytosine(967)-C(5))-methyltransferase RsmB [Rhodoferax lacus]|uniref:16S rRNA (cytosine(967)-C(5))-methyltransferase n=1 Tax=Rhodoferax lacus TaxID=2184758 RepID=A0A3E1R6E7_9BURK|nr:16S rRNA (cytosine(967)-C(5))-methyltransferase RsmB [Rhodoferax lacus]RFO94936.1 16S rRNA (cytosine(967)-C(5))-methyltransferase RsmB [Rhodoferax lacus]